MMRVACTVLFFHLFLVGFLSTAASGDVLSRDIGIYCSSDVFAPST